MKRKFFLNAVAAACLSLSGGLAAQESGSSQQITQKKKQARGVLLITSTGLKEAWKPFAEWKTALGKPTRIVTVDEIGAKYKGRDIQEKIKACVADYAANKSVKWVILGGDSQPGAESAVPDRDTPHVVMGRMRYRDIPTDLYYVSDKSWDANGDGIYGDWNNDREAISYGNKYNTAIGRIPVRTAEDVKNYTDKIIAYETRYPTKKFAKNIVYTNTVNHSQPKVTKSWDNYLSKSWADGKVYRFFHTKTPWDSERAGDYPLSPGNWAKMINDKMAGKMHMHGHGHLPVWVLEGHQNVTGRTVGSLSNKDAYLVMTTVSCFTGQFDNKKDPSITERMLRAPEKGAVIIIAPAREGVPVFHNPRTDFRLMVSEGKLDGTTETMTRFWVNGLKPQADGTYLTAGEAFTATKNHMAQHAEKTSGYHWCQCELNFLGDPTLDLRAKDPVTPKVRHTRTLAAGSAVVSVATGAPNSIVCLWQKGGTYRVVRADDKGKATIRIKSAKKGKMKITVSGSNLNTYVGLIEVK